MITFKPIDQTHCIDIHQMSKELPDSWGLENIQEWVCQETTMGFAAVEQDVFKAFVLFQVVSDQADLLGVAVRKDCKRQGLAETLINFAMDDLKEKGVETIFLEVAENNVPALTLYQKVGFEETGRRKGYYTSTTNGADAITMAWHLNGKPSA